MLTRTQITTVVAEELETLAARIEAELTRRALADREQVPTSR